MTGVASDSSTVFDRQSVLDMVDGELDFVHELIDLYLADVSAQRAEMRRAVEAGDAKTVQAITHRLKTSVGNLGGVRARPFVLELEHLARSGSLAGAESVFAQCNTELDGFEQALCDFKNEGL